MYLTGIGKVIETHEIDEVNRLLDAGAVLLTVCGSTTDCLYVLGVSKKLLINEVFADTEDGEDDQGLNELVNQTFSRIFFGRYEQWEGRAPTKEELCRAFDRALEEVKLISTDSFALAHDDLADEDVVSRLADYYVVKVREQNFERHLIQEEAFQVLEKLRDGFLASPPEMIKFRF